MLWFPPPLLYPFDEITFLCSSLPHYLGIVFYDGPVYITETSFFGFNNDDNKTFIGGALGFKPKNIASSSAASTVTDLRFGFSDKVSTV